MVGKSAAVVEQELRVAAALQKYAISMTMWKQKHPDAVFPATLTKAAGLFAWLVTDHGREGDIPFQRALREAIKAADLPQVLECVNDTTGKGECHLCAECGGCIARGGPFL